MLEVKNISFSYTANKKNIESLSFELEQGKMLSLVGESGSGKSTILKLIYGLLEWEEGEIYYNERKLEGFKTHLVPGETEFKYLEQDFGLMPYSTVGENIGNFLSNIQMEEKLDRIMFLLNLVEMREYINVKASNLSGGQKQRVALAKILAQTPSLLLLDEPFSQVDTFKKNILKRAVFDFAKENSISIILATHDIEDALAFSDEMIIIKEGDIVQRGEPSYIYQNPKNSYVANLFGEVNILQKDKFPEILDQVNESQILIYPHQFIASDHGLKVKVLKSYFMGDHYLVESLSRLQRIWFTSSHFFYIGEESSLQILGYQRLSE